MGKLSKYRSFILALCLVLAPSSTSAVPLLPSSFKGNPPAIEIYAPVDGVYMLIEHSEEGDRLVTHALLLQDDVAQFVMPKLDGRTSYHIQVMQDVLATHVMYKTVRYRGWVLWAPAVSRAPLSPVGLPVMGS